MRKRIFADFFMPSRIKEFEDLLKCALEHEYQTYSIHQFWKISKAGEKIIPGKILLLRHDIDTDPYTAGLMWKIENSLGIKSTYFFRLSTLDIQLMRNIENAGGEASYHYEELSTICKRDKIKSLEGIQDRIHEIRALFARNLWQLREKTGLPIKSAASHGDFINRRLGIRNVEVLKDLDFRKEVGIDVEAYDESAMKQVESRFSDAPYPMFWKPSDPVMALKNNIKIVYILVHPRHWKTDLKINLADDIKRFYEQARYSV